MKDVFKICHSGSGHDYRVQRRATLNTDTWDDELHADSRLETDIANSSIRATTPAKSSTFTTSLHLPDSSRMQSLSLQASPSASS